MNKVANKKRKSEETNVPGLKRKEYEQKLRNLHVELVKLQEWVKSEGKKVCVIFEGRDGAGKGGVIKAMTERVSPRVFRVVAMAAPTEREKTQMYVQRYLPHRRGRTGHGLLHGGSGQGFLEHSPFGRKVHGRIGNCTSQVLA